jgi:hypothetical protein
VKWVQNTWWIYGFTEIKMQKIIEPSKKFGNHQVNQSFMSDSHGESIHYEIPSNTKNILLVFLRHHHTQDLPLLLNQLAIFVQVDDSLQDLRNKGMTRS